jgi:HTH-type transcriptional regulator, sugar sensing transcriptional regulator
MFEQFLEEIGLSEKEAKIYLALLQVDSSTIHDISEKTGVNRTTVYPVLESLEKKGLVSEIQVGKKIEYQAAPPERLETYVERQKATLQEKSERLKDIIPQIKSIQREQGERPIIKVFQGRDGAISAYTEFFNFSSNLKKDGYYILNNDLLAEVFTEKEMGGFRELRKDKKVITSIVYNRKDGERSFEDNKAAVRINDTEYPLTCDIAIIDDNVVISTLGENVTSLLIKSKDIAKTLASLIQYITK